VGVEVQGEFSPQVFVAPHASGCHHARSPPRLRRYR
jgi:hypothetical protein